MFRHFSFFVNSILLFTIPASAFYPQSHQSEVPAQVQKVSQDNQQTERFLIPSYDEIMNLLDDLESGELEKRCNTEDLDNLNHYLVFLAQEGVLPDDSEEISSLEDDIEKLLYGKETPYKYTGGQMFNALTLLADLALTEQWGALSEVLSPEIRQFIKEWDTIPSNKKGEIADYAFGKYGSDIVIPGAFTKVVSKEVKGAKELGRVSKALQTAEKTLLLESVAGLESGTKVAKIVLANQRAIALREELGYDTISQDQFLNL